MLTRHKLQIGRILELKCYGCDIDLSNDEIKEYDELDGLCEQCYSSAMEAAYDDGYFDDFNIGLDDLEDE